MQPQILLTDNYQHIPPSAVPLTLNQPPLFLGHNKTHLQRAVNEDMLFSVTQPRHPKTTWTMSGPYFLFTTKAMFLLSVIQRLLRGLALQVKAQGWGREHSYSLPGRVHVFWGSNCHASESLTASETYFASSLIKIKPDGPNQRWGY